MTTAATDSHGTLLQRGNGASPEIFTTVAEVRDIDAPGISKNRHEATSHDSNGWSERISGIKTLGEMSCEINWIPSNTTHNEVAGLIYDATSETDRNYRLVFPDASAEKMTFRGTVTEFQSMAPVDGVLRAKVKFDATGAPTWSN